MYKQIYLEVQSNPTYSNSYKKGILLMALSYSVQNHSIPIAVVARWAKIKLTRHHNEIRKQYYEQLTLNSNY